MSLEDGLILFKNRDFHGASEHFYEVVKENGENHKAWNALGVCLSQMGNYTDANTCFFNAIQIDPDIEQYKKNLEKNQKFLKKLNNESYFEKDSTIKSNVEQTTNFDQIKPTYFFWLMFVAGVVISVIPLFKVENFPWYLPFLYRIAVAYLVYDDAKKIGTGNSNSQDPIMKWTPIGWGIIVLFVWIIFLPLYAYKRNNWLYNNNNDLGYEGSKFNSSTWKIIGISIIILIFVGLVEAAIVSSSLETKVENYYYNKGVELLESGNYKEGINALNQAIQLDPNNADAWNNKAWAYNQMKEYEKSIESSEHAIQLNPNDADSYFNKGGALIGLGRNEEAIIALDEALRIDPNYEVAKQARNLILTGKYASNSNQAIEWYNKGVDLGTLGQYQEAIEAYDQALKINPELTAAWYNKGMDLGTLGRYQEAIEAYDQALKINPEFTEVWSNKGVDLGYLGRYQEAIEAYDQALKINPELTLVWYNKGVALDNLGRYQEAIVVYDQALKINPRDAEAWYNKGVDLGYLGRYNDEIVAYDQALKINPEHVLAWNNKGWALNTLGRYQEAIAALDQAVKINPGLAEAWYNKGVALEKLGRYEEANVAYEQALKINPELG